MAIHLPSPKGLMTSTVLTLLLCGVHNAGATPILDQSFEPPNTNLLLGMGPGNSGAQTFTVGITGTLARVDVFVERNGFEAARPDQSSRVPLDYFLLCSSRFASIALKA